MIPQILYTNKNCQDVWQIFYDQNKKFYNGDLYVISDTDKFLDVDQKKIYTYENSEPYWKVWVNALEKFGLENFIYLQEDFILYDQVDTQKITSIQNFLNSSNYSFVRLIKSGNLNSNKIEDNLFEIESNNQDIFSMQPSIWKTKDYSELMSGVMESKWLENYKYREFMVDKNMKGLYYYNGENKRGLNHYDSSIYPYIATALVRGKWNLSEYNNELKPLLEKYKIKINLRGIF